MIACLPDPSSEKDIFGWSGTQATIFTQPKKKKITIPSFSPQSLVPRVQYPMSVKYVSRSYVPGVLVLGDEGLVKRPCSKEH